MPRWKLKECPRCGGDIFMDIDENGWLGHCLQCGYMGKGPSITPQAGIVGNMVMQPVAVSNGVRAAKK
jgi:ribosomal protein S27AE